MRSTKINTNTADEKIVPLCNQQTTPNTNNRQTIDRPTGQLVDGAQGTVLHNMTAWSNCRGMSKVDAIKKYVTKSNQLVEAYSK
jgi:acyl-CoA-binding protein